ncbi:MAG: hypothetical protein ACI9JY_001606, partial [Saprospiraceae bacterium]
MNHFEIAIFYLKSYPLKLGLYRLLILFGFLLILHKLTFFFKPHFRRSRLKPFIFRIFEGFPKKSRNHHEFSIKKSGTAL